MPSYHIHLTDHSLPLITFYQRELLPERTDPKRCRIISPSYITRINNRFNVLNLVPQSLMLELQPDQKIYDLETSSLPPPPGNLH